jgi:hypothetical protein
MNTFRRSKAAMVKGEKMLRKWRRNEGLKEFNEAMFPVPKKANNKEI